jgi:hypothetical protein
VLERIEARGGFTFAGARTRGFRRVQAIGVDLCGGCHIAARYQATRRNRRGGRSKWLEMQGEINLIRR